MKVCTSLDEDGNIIYTQNKVFNDATKTGSLLHPNIGVWSDRFYIHIPLAFTKYNLDKIKKTLGLGLTDISNLGYKGYNYIYVQDFDVLRHHNYVKFGYSEDVMERGRKLRGNSGKQLTLLKSFPVRQPKKLEAVIKKVYSYRHNVGEWYTLTAHELADLCQCSNTKELLKLLYMVYLNHEHYEDLEQELLVTHLINNEEFCQRTFIKAKTVNEQQSISE